MDDMRKKLEALLQGQKMNEAEALPEEIKALPKNDFRRFKEAQALEDKKFDNTIQKYMPFGDAPIEDKPRVIPKIQETVEGRKRYDDFMRSHTTPDEQKLKDLDMLMQKKKQEQMEYEDIAAEFDRAKPMQAKPELPMQQKVNMAKELPSGPMDMSDPEQVSRYQDLIRRMSGK